MNRAQLLAPMAHRQQALEARFGLRVAAVVDAAPLHADVQERLRFARQQAVQKAAAVRRTAATPGVVLSTGGGSAALGAPSWWLRLASFAPLMVLALGLLLVGQLDAQEQIQAAAEIDAVLLADDLPPRAYADPGFTEYLKQAGP